MINRIFKFPILFLLMALVSLTACNHRRNHPGYAYMPDMYYSEAAEPYTENPLFRDSLTMQAPPKGTIARGHEPAYPYLPRSADEQKRAGLELANPVPLTPEALAQGKEQYTIFCAMCHGDRGDGKGFLFTSKRFPAQPTSLAGDLVKNKPDGEIYHVITLGTLSGLMGAHASQISPENRWKIVHYVRELGK
ncbi:MAG TPA: c-type cytochrome [Bacteroidales bacterium]|nr:c-type cytochrome [Bacteroidales bacterium]HPI85858.1 c-type cytochrome [Bacteroidales bacterium]